jgi:putative ABC transport system substrate-binding protein
VGAARALSDRDYGSTAQTRRSIVTTAVCLAAFGWPLPAFAQTVTRPKQVAIVYNSVPLCELTGPEPSDPDARAFVRAMRNLGWIEGSNVTIRFLSAEGRFERLPGLLAQVARSGADALGLTVAWIKVEALEQMEAGLAQVLDEKADAILVDDTQITFARRRTIAEFALQHRLPTISAYQEFVEAGALLAYDANAGEITRLAASYVDKILKGTKPSDLPVVRPTVFDLAVNARTVRAPGLAIPPSLQLRITRVIE